MLLKFNNVCLFFAFCYCMCFANDCKTQGCFEVYNIPDKERFDISRYMYHNTLQSIKAHIHFANSVDCKHWERLESHSISMKANNGQNQFFLCISNDQSSSYSGYLHLKNPNIDSISIYSTDLSYNDYFSYSERTPMKQREVLDVSCAFPLSLEPYSQVYLLIDIFHDQLSLHTGIELVSEVDFAEKVQTRNILLGIYFGIECLLLLFTPLLLYFRKDYKLIIAYLLFHIVVFLGLTDNSGYLLGYFLPELSEYEKESTIIFILLFNILFVELCSQLFRDDSLNWLRHYRNIIFLVFFLPVFIYQRVVFYQDNIALLMVLFTFFCLFQTIWIVAKNYKKDIIVTRLFVFSTSLIIIVCFVRAFIKLTGIEAGFIYNHGLIITSIIENLGFFILIGYLLNKSSKEAVAEKYKNVELENKLIKDRQRIGQELHDDLGSGLTRIKYLTYGIQGASESDVKKIRSIEGHSDSLVQSMREIIWAMDSKSDNCESFVSYIRRFIRDYLSENNLEVEFDINITDPQLELDGKTRRNLLLVIKEATNNLVKHSDASLLKVKIVIDESIRICYSDNGNGKLIRGNGYGLQNMNRMIQELSGSFQIQSEEGTRILIEVPIIYN